MRLTVGHYFSGSTRFAALVSATLLAPPCLGDTSADSGGGDRPTVGAKPGPSPKPMPRWEAVLRSRGRVGDSLGVADLRNGLSPERRA